MITLDEEIGDDCLQGRLAIAQRLRQRLQQPQHLFADHPRHQPVEARRIDLVEERERYRQRDPVFRMTGLEAITQWQRIARDVHRLRKLRLRDVARVMPHQVFARQVQQRRILLLRLGPPFFERRAIGDAGRNDRIEECDDIALVDQHVLATCLVLEFSDVLEQRAIVFREWRVDSMLAWRQCFTQKHVAREHRIDRAEAHAPPCHQREAV